MTRELDVRFTDLGVTRRAVVRQCGGAGEAFAGTLDRAIDTLLTEAPAHTDPRGGYVLTTQRFDTGPIIAEQLAGSERVAVFLATLGAGFDRWSRAFFAAGDPFSGFIVDAIGSVAVEATGDRLAEAVKVEAQAGDMGVTNRLSPGYCGWDVVEQHRLFRSFPDGFLGVRLTDAALMVPLKSVSGVIGIGPGLRKRAYPCKTCEIEPCPVRRRRTA